MSKSPKTEQLQIRVSRGQKAAILRAAESAGMDMSAYVLGRVLPERTAEFRRVVEACAEPQAVRFALAELNSLLSSLTAGELRDAVSEPPPTGLTSYIQNYVAAMVEYACVRRNVPVPEWTRRIAALAEPVFGSQLQSLRLYLLVNSPPPFRARNIFIDATIGDQV